MSVVLWSGGGYEGREGIEVAACPDGLHITAWYDGGVSLEDEGVLSWDAIEAMKETQQEGAT